MAPIIAAATGAATALHVYAILDLMDQIAAHVQAATLITRPAHVNTTLQCIYFNILILFLRL